MFRKLMHRILRRRPRARARDPQGCRLIVEHLEERSLLSAALPTVTTLSVPASTVVAGQPVALTANVSLAYPNGGAPTDGSVVFMDGTIALGTEPLVNGAAFLSTAALSAGTHLIAADYTGDGVNFAPSTNMIGPSSIINTVAGGGQLGPPFTTPAGLEYGDGGPATAAYLLGSAPIAVDSGGDIFIGSGNAVREVSARTGLISTVAGTWVPGYSGDGGPATAAELNGVAGLAVDATGDLFIADNGNGAVREVNLATGIITTIAGGTTGVGVGAPVALVLDGAGGLFIASSYGPAVRELNLATGAASVVAGDGAEGDTGDGGQATAAELDQIGGIAVDNAGHLFIGTSAAVREVNLSTGIIATVAGNGTLGYSGDGGPATAAELASVGALALDGEGHLFINTTGIVAMSSPLGPPAADIPGGIRELDLATGTISTFVGAGGAGSENGGPVGTAEISAGALCFDSSGDLFIGCSHAAPGGQYWTTVGEVSPPAVIDVAPATPVDPAAVGLYNPTTSTFFLRYSNSSGNADVTFSYGWVPAAGKPALVPLSGDWTGSGVANVGLYDPATSTFYLRDSNTAGAADITFNFGPAGAGWIPIAGNWTGTSTTYVGLYDPTTSTFFLRYSDAPGAADDTFGYGPAKAGWTPITGNWAGNSTTTVGLYDAASSTFFLRSSNTAGAANETFGYGPAGAGWTPIAGDWTGSGAAAVGLVAPSSSTYFLRNSCTAGAANTTFGYGPAGQGWIPLAGDWTGVASAAPTVVQPNGITGFSSPLSELVQARAVPIANSPLSELVAPTAAVAGPVVSAATQTLNPQAVDQADPASVAQQALSSPTSAITLDSTLDDLVGSGLPGVDDTGAAFAGYGAAG